MYGIINKAIQDLVTDNFGAEKWSSVLEKSGIGVDFFISNEAYDDEVTFKLALAVADETKLSVGEVLESFGEWWILKTTKEKYGGLLKTGGSSLKEFLINLPSFHNNIMILFPKLTPPEFKVSDLQENSIHIHYFSKREGLQEFVKGLLIGLGKMYESPVEVLLIQSRLTGSDHEIFKVSW